MSANASGGGRRKRIDDKPIDVGDAQREVSRRRFLKYAGASAAVIPAYGAMMDVLSEDASAATLKANAHIAAFANHKRYKFVMDCHVTTNSFFTATIYGIQDACSLIGCSYQWTGSTNSITGQMVAAMNSAIA
ncbi:MAG TPA: hypothetical protein VG293_04935, partial [Solirubrobacteraceae bacterium]|nr:hypothetical protein [Solirubrobacteraceae bacterium]